MKTSLLILCLLLSGLTISNLPAGEPRVWTKATDSSKTFTGKLHNFDETTGEVSLIVNGKLIKVNQSILSKEDLLYIKQQTEPPAEATEQVATFKLADPKDDWKDGQIDGKFDLRELEIRRTSDSDTISIMLKLDEYVPQNYSGKTHYRLDFDLDSSDKTNHNGRDTGYGGDALVYISLLPIDGAHRNWETYVRTFSDIGEKAGLKPKNLTIEGKMIRLEISSRHFRDNDFSIYLMTYGNGKFFDEMPNGKDVKVSLPQKK